MIQWREPYQLNYTLVGVQSRAETKGNQPHSPSPPERDQTVFCGFPYCIASLPSYAGDWVTPLTSLEFFQIYITQLRISALIFWIKQNNTSDIRSFLSLEEDSFVV